ncbi:MAG: hypothetical protein NTX52_03425 [Planctomycetota bacterium]|nr:hypothetical protein [Planctomycetota bacterium]
MTTDRIDKNSEAASISLVASVAGWALALMVTLAVYLKPSTNFLAWSIYVGNPCFFSLEISAFTVGLLEGRAKLRKVGLFFSVTGIIFGVVAALRKLYGINNVFVFFPWLVAPNMAVSAGVWAIALKKERTKGSMPMFILWLTPVGMVAVALLFLRAALCRGFPAAEDITAVFALLFGPWATLAAKIGVWPNAGEFFHLPLAVTLTVAMAAVVTVVLKAKNKSIAGVSIILFMALVLSWFAVGYVQLINCHE